MKSPAFASSVRRESALEEYAVQVRDVLETEDPDLLVFSPNRQALDGSSLYETLVGIEAITTEGYRRIPQGRLRAIDHRLDDWVVYEREPEPF